MASRSGYIRGGTDPDPSSVADDGDVFADLDPEIDAGGEPGFETKEERKRLWWRNGIINALFMGVWYAYSLDTSSASLVMQCT